ncbi:IS21-like element helper ATPase IstB [bacterium]|nr:IS21-like element helper ATPase IstB [bacterium]
MNNNQTVEKLRTMRISAMADLHLNHLKTNQTGQHTPDEYLSLLTDCEFESRHNKKVDRLLHQARFKQSASIAEVDYASQRNLEKNMFHRLASLEFMKQRQNIILTGASGVGKSYLAQAIGNQACLMTHRVAYHTTARLLHRLKLAKLDGTYDRELKKLIKIELLILDDFGLQAFDNHARETLMDIIDDRFNKCSTIVASQLPVSVWYDIIGEGTIADAILDRIVNSSHRIDLKGESLRKGIVK